MNNDIRSLASETHLQLTTPVQVIPHQESRRNGQVIGESFVLRPWIGLSDSDEFTISADIVLTIGSLKKEVRQQYVNYIEHTNETQKRHEDQVEREEAAVNLLREITPGELYFIDEPLNTENDHDNNQE
jgi:hypothetical protein